MSLSLSLRWMENVSLEVIATCGHPPEIRGQKVQDVNVFTSCPESGSPPDRKVVVAPRPPQLKKHKPSLLKAPGSKARPVKAKAKILKPTKNRPHVKPVAPKVTKKKKTL